MIASVAHDLHCKHFRFLLGEQKLSHEKKNHPADSEKLEIDELHFDIDRKLPARREETANSQRPLTSEEDQMQEKLIEMNHCGIHLQSQKKELEDVNLSKEKEKQGKSSQSQSCEIEEHAQLSEDEEQEVKSERQLDEIERHMKFAQKQSQGKEEQLSYQKIQMHG